MLNTVMKLSVTVASSAVTMWVIAASYDHGFLGDLIGWW